jgi:hypothetical protein
MYAGSQESLVQKEVVTDLKSAIEARRELGGELEEQVLEAFLAQVQQRIDAQVNEQLEKNGFKSPAEKRKGNAPAWVFPASLLLSLPMVAAAGFYGGALGIVAVMVALISVTAIWLDNFKG